MDKLMITACICGTSITKEQNPAVPYTVKEIANEAYAAYKAGASIIHLHVRNDDGTPTHDGLRIKECIDAIRAKCPDVIIQLPICDAENLVAENDLETASSFVEMVTLDHNTCSRIGADAVKRFLTRLAELKIKPEIEVFDSDMLDMPLALNRDGFIKSPLHFVCVMDAESEERWPAKLLAIKKGIPNASTFTVAGLGISQFNAVTLGIISGGHIRVGFEDNIYLSDGVLAKSNAELVEKAARLSSELGRAIASPDEARAMLSLDKRS